jgi:hypothetical protein
MFYRSGWLRCVVFKCIRVGFWFWCLMVFVCVLVFWNYLKVILFVWCLTWWGLEYVMLVGKGLESCLSIWSVSVYLGQVVGCWRMVLYLILYSPVSYSSLLPIFIPIFLISSVLIYFHAPSVLLSSSSWFILYVSGVQDPYLYSEVHLVGFEVYPVLVFVIQDMLFVFWDCVLVGNCKWIMFIWCFDPACFIGVDGWGVMCLSVSGLVVF